MRPIKFFRLLDRRSCPRGNSARKPPLTIEELEDRTVPTNSVGFLSTSLLPGPNSSGSTVQITSTNQAALSVHRVFAVSSHYVKVVFHRPADLTATDPATYSIIDSKGNPLTVYAVQLSGNRKVATLTTDTQSNQRYSLQFHGATANRMWRFRGSLRQEPSLVNVVSTGTTSVQLTFDQVLGRGATDLQSYQIANPNLTITSVRLEPGGKKVTLTTAGQDGIIYIVRAAGVNNSLGIPINPTRDSLAFVGNPGPLGSTLPRVTGAISTSNTTLVVAFSKPMGDDAIDPRNYAVTQENVHPESGTIFITGARFTDSNRTAVELRTTSQNELAYTVTAVNIHDIGGNPLAPAAIAGGLRVDPSRASFRGTPPAPGEFVDTDGDGLADHEELRGWTVTIRLTNGTEIRRTVTSHPLFPDTDGDGLDDRLEAALRTDPRDADSDDDQLSDYQEYNEIYSDPTNQDTDRDGLDDGLEFHFFKTSPVLSDTDGDQLLDGDEVLLANRNARVADLPAPTLSISGVDLRLDVRFVETSSKQTRVLQNKSVSSQLTQSESQEFSNSHSATVTATAKTIVKSGYEVKANGPFSSGGEWSTSVQVETGVSGSWTGTWTETSSQQTQKQYQESLEFESEDTKALNVERQVVGAALRASVSLRNTGNLAFRLKNLQVTAFILDPQDPTRLIPLATLLPDNEPPEGFTLGPLVPERGPIVFSNTTIFPNLVEALMRNPRGLVFRFSNYDIVDEFGRNFAFTSRDIVDRTGSLTIDFGGFDSDGDGQGDFTEYHRIATSAGRVIDTNGNGQIDNGDRRVIFDSQGKQVGITLREALAAIGLTHYYEFENPTSSLTETEQKNSYSTVFDDAGVERIYRIRGTGFEPGKLKMWEVITPTGINHSLGLDDVILTPEQDIKLAFVQDLDSDRLPASLEFLNNTSDALRDTDGDTLDDRFEMLIGWKVDLGPRGMRWVFSSGSLRDTDGDGVDDQLEAPGALLDLDGDGLIDRAEWAGPGDFVTDPTRIDTDGDGLSDGIESDPAGYQVQLRRNGNIIIVHTDPTLFDTDGDTASDGVEFRLGGNGMDIADRDDFADDDGDGLVNIEEIEGWTVNYRLVSTEAGVEGSLRSVHVTSDPFNADTDGDGIPDGEEFRLKTNPRSIDTDEDGLSDTLEIRGFQLRNLGVIVTNPLDQDTDNDKLSDGVEAELVDIEANRWVVRVYGAAPYRVWSDPTQADADFDGLVDGDERAQGSDPNLADTDGDKRNDRLEFQYGTSPLRADFRITVLWQWLFIEHDADVDGDGFGAGDIEFDFYVRVPSTTSPSGLAPRTKVLDDQDVEPYLPPSSNPPDDGDTPPLRRNLTRPGIGIPSGWTLNLANYMNEYSRSYTFALAPDQRFGLEAQIREVDFDSNGHVYRTVYVDLGGLSGLPVDFGGSRRLAVWQGSEFSFGVYEVTFSWQDHDTLGQVNSDNQLQGKLKAYIFVD
jgi:hypothetical protein